jgi:hypothetical protein
VRELTCKGLICSWAPHQSCEEAEPSRARVRRAALCRQLFPIYFFFGAPSSAPRRPKGPFAPRHALTAGHRLSVHHDGSGWPPCVSFACRVKVPNVAAVQCLHHADPAEHRGAAEFDQHQRLDRGLPLGKVRFLIRSAGNVARRVALGDQPSAVGQRGSTNSRCRRSNAPRTSNRTWRNRVTGCRFILGLDTNSRR